MMPPQDTAMSGGPAPDPARKSRNVHVPCLTGWIRFHIPISATDMASIEAANKLLSAAIKVLSDGKAVATAEASLGKVPGNLLP